MKYALRRAERRGAGHYESFLSKTGGKELTFPPVFGADGEICALGGRARKTAGIRCFVVGRSLRPAQSFRLLASPQIS